MTNDKLKRSARLHLQATETWQTGHCSSNGWNREITTDTKLLQMCKPSHVAIQLITAKNSTECCISSDVSTWILTWRQVCTVAAMVDSGWQMLHVVTTGRSSSVFFATFLWQTSLLCAVESLLVTVILTRWNTGVITQMPLAVRSLLLYGRTSGQTLTSSTAFLSHSQPVVVLLFLLLFRSRAAQQESDVAKPGGRFTPTR